MPRKSIQSVQQTSSKAPTKRAKKNSADTYEAAMPIKTAVSKNQRASSVSAQVYDTTGTVVDTIDLPKNIFGTKVNKALIAQAVRVYLANKRSGTASTKTRGEVRGSTRKIYKQKGTGRARHGSKRAPIFVHGGIVFGPRPKDYSLSLPKKMRKAALFSALSAKYQESEIKVVSGLESLGPKTKVMVQVIEKLGMNNHKKNILIVLPKYEVHAKKSVDAVMKASRNIQGVEYMVASQLNTYDVLKHRTLLFMKEAIQTLEKTFI